jgi:hypothetical protein
MPHPLQALVYVLLGYLALQILLNVLVRTAAQRSSTRALTALKGSFWAGVVNAIFFIAASVWLHQSGIAPNRGPDENTKWWALAGLPAGIALWFFSAKARGLGIRLFGSSNIISGDDAILHMPPSPAYINWGIANQTFIQPLGRELFLRGAFLPLAVLHLGWGLAIPATLLVELAPRLNVVWLPLTLLHGLSMITLFWLSGGALTGLIASAVSGCMHSFALVYLSARNQRMQNDSELAEVILKQPRRKRK